jgi:NAD(P)-dependent dehydrogenase (short-subunit alcohol dehydrogenase family)
MRLQDKSIVITGASSGMGKSMVELFAREGANVVAVARREERLKELQESLKDAPGKVEIFVGDVSLRENNEKMIDLAVEKFGKLDVLVNNAGIMDGMEPVGKASDEKFEKLMKVNVYGPMCAMRKAVNVFLEQGNGGSIINVASVGAKKTIAGAVYCSTKAALTMMSQNTAFMYANDKIRCNVLAPGGIETEISSSMGRPDMDGYGRVKIQLAGNPWLGSGMDVARAALFFASDDSAYINGVFMPVDAGWSAG